jgi:hypothetical protein
LVVGPEEVVVVRLTVPHVLLVELENRLQLMTREL